MIRVPYGDPSTRMMSMPSKIQRFAHFARAGLLLAGLVLAGCTESTFEDVSAKASKGLPPKVLAAMSAKGMKRDAPVMARIFKEEGKVEIWKQKGNGRYDVIAEYDICKWSGKLGPKFIEGDRQAPEGFYTVRPSQMNPNSSYHLAFNIGYPNAFDRAHGRTGSNLMVHGACSSSGCYSMTDAQIEEIYAFGRDAFRGGQTEFQIQAFPFRMTPANMARYRDDPNYAFWKNLKEGYDNFEITKVPPKVDVCERRYVFNADAGEAKFSPTGACPSFTQPETLRTAYQSYQSKYDAAFASAVNSGGALAPKPTIAGLKEANLVREWTKKRARGERVTLEPPVLAADGTVATTTTRMGRIDSPAGRKMAALDAEREAEEKAKREKEEALAKAKREKEEAEALAKAAAAAPAEETASVPSADPAFETQADTDVGATQAKPGFLGRMTKRITNIF